MKPLKQVTHSIPRLQVLTHYFWDNNNPVKVLRIRDRHQAPIEVLDS